MKGVYLYITIIFLLCVNVIDSAASYSVNKDYTVDTTLVKKQLKSASKLAIVNPDSGFTIINKLYQQYESMPADLQSDILSELGRAFFLKGNTDSASKYMNTAISQYRKINYKHGLGKAFMNKSALFFSLADFDSALVYQDSALIILEEFGEYELLKRLYYNMSNLLKVKGAYDESLKYISKGLALSETMNDTLHICYLYSMLGLIHSNLGHVQTAREYYMKTLEYSHKINSTNIEMISYERMGTLETKDYNKAIFYYKKALDLSRQINDYVKMTEIMANIGGVYITMDSVSKALDFFDKAVKICMEKNILTSYIQISLNMIEIDINQKKYSEAIDKLEKLSDLIHKSKYHYYVARYHNLYSRAEAEQSDYKTAYDNLLISKKLTDSLFNEETRNEYSALAFNYQYKIKSDSLQFMNNIRIKEQQAEMDKRKRYSYGIIELSILYIIASLLVLYFYRLRQKRKLTKMKDEILLYQQIALSQQINPDFILKILNSIKTFIREKNKEESMEFIASFAQLMRLTLYNLHGHLIILKDELEVLDLFLNIEKIKSEDKIHIVKNIDDNVDVENAHIPSLLFQSIIDNLLKFNSLNKYEKFRLSYTITTKNEMLNCIFENVNEKINHYSYKECNDDEFVSDITRKRFDLLTSYYKKKFDFRNAQLINLQGETVGLRIELDLPLVKN